MRRSPLFRSLATLLALWLPLIAGEPGLLHPCPMHGAGRAVVASLLGESVPTATPMSHAHHQGHSQSPAQNHHDCTCINCCTVTATTFVAPDVPAIEFLVAEHAADRSVPGAELLARPSPEHSRPYTTGPPRA